MIKKKIIMAHMRAAYAYGATSHAVRTQVGAVIINRFTEQPITIGYNGTPSGHDNRCETEVDGNLVTKDSVIHAEDNAIRRLPSGTVKSDLTLFTSHSPCPSCARKIFASGIEQVFYGTGYRILEGIEFLVTNCVEVYQVNIETGEIWFHTYDESGLHLKPAKFNKHDILYDSALESIYHENSYSGAKTYNTWWMYHEVVMAVKLFQDGADPFTISTRLNRSCGSICSLLQRQKLLSFKKWTGYMKSIPGERSRDVWCTTRQVNANRIQIESVMKRFAPAIHGMEVTEAQEKYGHLLSPYLINRAIKGHITLRDN